MKPLLTITILLITSLCFAQNKIVRMTFFKFDGRYVSQKDSADYFQLVSEPDSGSKLFNVTEYYKDRKRKLVGNSSTIEPTTFEGQCATFYDSGKRRSLTNFKNGLPVGDKYDFFSNGKLYLQTDYPDNGDKYNSLDQNFLIRANFDSLGTALVENGNGYYKGYDDKFSYIDEEGPVKNGKRDSLWKGIDKNLDITYTENYKDGVMISGTSMGKDGNPVAYTKSRAVPPQFKGGLDAFGQYLGRNINYPDDARQNNVQGRVILSFVVEKNGKVTEVKVSKSVSPSIDAEAVRVLQNSPAWAPGTEYGRKVRVAYSVPVNFSLTE